MGKKDQKIKYSKQFAFESHLAQYEAIRKDTNLATSLQNNLVNYSIIAIGGMIAVITLVEEQDLAIPNYVWLAFSFLFSMITWAALEADFRIHDVTRYLKDVLRVKVQNLIGKGDISDEFLVFETELAGGTKINFRTVIRGLFSCGKFIISFFPGAITLWYYMSLNPDWCTQFLFWVAAIPLLLIPIAIIAQGIFVWEYYWGEKNGDLKEKKVKKSPDTSKNTPE